MNLFIVKGFVGNKVYIRGENQYTKMDIKVITYLSKDPIMAQIIVDSKVTNLTNKENIYVSLTSSIISQQLSVRVAEVIYSRFRDLFTDGLVNPADLLKFTDEELRGVGISFQKMGYIRNISQYFSENSPDISLWQTKPDEQIIKELTTIKGVGVWTVQMLLIFTLHRPDVFPVSDLGVQRSIEKHYGIAGTQKEIQKQMLILAEEWRPYRSFASRYLWAGL